ncbi:MAG: GlsB/YeaQ/YmgE family stress response membrane protein [Syntrophomonadaceae bacterium]
MTHLIGAIIIGGIAGGIAKLLMPGKDPGGCVITIILGIIGAVVATYLGRILGLYGPGQSAGFIGAVVGAVIVLGIYRLIVGRRKTL